MSTATLGYAGNAPVIQLRPRVGKSHLVLTRRGRVFFTTLASIPLVVLALMFALNSGGAQATIDTVPAGSYEYVTVEAGGSLWALAEELAPSADPRDVISDILNFNGMSSAELFPGQRLAIPSQYSD